MTAVEFLEEKQKLSKRQWQMPFLSALICILFLSMVYGYRAVYNHKYGQNFLLMAVIFLVAAVIPPWILGKYCDKRYSRFIKDHPEMKDLDEWKVLMGSAERYPVDNEARAAFAPEARSILELYARWTNACFNFMEAMRTFRDVYKRNSDQEWERGSWKSINCTWEMIAARADEVNKTEYLRRWKLFIDDMGIAISPNDPRDFREGFLEDDRLFQVGYSCVKK
jgi:hypothetical protein